MTNEQQAALERLHRHQEDGNDVITLAYAFAVDRVIRVLQSNIEEVSV